jgi:hypothetical protein
MQIFLREGLDDPNQIETKGEFFFHAHGLGGEAKSIKCTVAVVCRPPSGQLSITVIPPYSRKPAGEARYGAEPLINLSKSIVNLTLHERAPGCENLQGEPMREIAIIITAMAALSAMSRGNAHFVPLPTGPLPAVNVP